LEALLELLWLERVLGPHPREDLRGEPGKLGVLEGGALAERVADAQGAGVEQADHVPWPGLLDHLPVGAEELVRHRQPDRLLLPGQARVHAPVETTGADAQER